MSASAATHVKRCLRANPGAIPTPATAPDFERHRRKCAVCNHPEREAIEELFIYWHSAGSITDHFDLPDWSTIYRHAHAAGLYERRRHNVRAVLDHLLEGVEGVEATPMSIVNAVRAYACLTDSGGWLEPEKRIRMTTVVRHGNTAAASTSSADTTPPVGALLAAPAPARQAEGPRGTGSQPVRSSSSLPPARRGGEASSENSPRSAPLVGAGLALPAPAQQASRQGTTSVVPSSGGQSGVSTPEATEKSREAPDLQTSNLRPQTSSTPNRQSPELESSVSHSKQTTAPPSNRQIPPHAQRELPLARKGVAKLPKR